MDRRLTVAKRLAKAPPRKRASKGTGSVYAEKDGEGHILRYRGEITVAGVRHRPSGDAADQVWAKLRAIRAGEDPQAAAASADTVESWVRNYLDQQRTRLRPKTVLGHMRACELYVYPALGVVPITELTPGAVYQLVSKLQKSGLSNSRVHNIVAPLSKALEAAVKEDRIKRNPASGLEIGKRGSGFQVAGGWSKKRTQDILDAFWGHEYYDLYALLIYSGCRLGELLALDWSSVRLAAKEIEIRRTWSYEWDGEGGITPAFGPPKTEAGLRTVALNDEAVARLWNRYHEAGNAKRGLVFPSKTKPGQPVSPSIVLRRWKEGLDRAGFPPMRLHDLRHIAISRLVAAGVDYALVARRAGHKSPAITMALYAHANDARAHEAAKTANLFPEGHKPPKQIGAAVPPRTTPNTPKAADNPPPRGATITPQEPKRTRNRA